MSTLTQCMDVLSAACPGLDASSCEFHPRGLDSVGIEVNGCTVGGCEVWVYLLRLEQSVDAYVLTEPLYCFVSLGPHLKTWHECVGYYRLYPLSSVTIKELCPSLVLSRTLKRLGL